MGMGGGYNMYRRENACSLGSQTSKVHATGTSLLLYYMWISIVHLFTIHDIDYHVVLVHLSLTLHSISPTPHITTNILFTWSLV